MSLHDRILRAESKRRMRNDQAREEYLERLYLRRVPEPQARIDLIDGLTVVAILTLLAWGAGVWL